MPHEEDEQRRQQDGKSQSFGVANAVEGQRQPEAGQESKKEDSTPSEWSR